MDKGVESYRRFLGGDDTALAELIREYKDGLILFINRYVNDLHTAEELTEEVFFRLVTKKPGFYEKSSFKTWLFTVGRNEAVSYLRQSKCISLESYDELADTASIEESYLRTERKIAVHRALGCINPDYAKALHLSYFEELSNEETARVMNKNKRQIENLLYRAKKALKIELIKEGFIYEDL